MRIEKLAPTGEGIARTPEGVGFVDRALPGELVETTLYEVRKRFWRGALRAVLEASPDRVASAHSDCAGCDWAHFESGAARAAKRSLFLETMQRIGRLGPHLLGPLPIAASGAGYRLRTRLHASGTGPAAAIGFFAPGTHRLESAAACEAISPATRRLLPAVREAIAESGARVSEVAVLEDLEGGERLLRATAASDPGRATRLGLALSGSFQGVRVRSEEARSLFETGQTALALPVGGRRFGVSVDSFFQSNRHLVDELYSDVAEEASGAAPGLALDAFGGVGLFAGGLLEAGHRVFTVEADAGSVGDARSTREQWPDRDRWEIVAATVRRFLDEADRRFDCVVVDPPRAGLGADLARDIARRVARLLVYVSCDPATLARDLGAIRAEGLEIRRAKLYDFFAFTHRVESMVCLERAA